MQEQLKKGKSLQGGKYKIEKVLGQGGFGITYLATQELLGRKVCIKEFFFKDSCGRNLKGEVTFGTVGNRVLVERFHNKFIKEARMLSQLDHPNIIRVLDVFKENNTAYYVMDFIEGCSLEDIVRTKGALSESVAIDYIKQVANALDYIHKRNLNHLDIKPANIMIRKCDNKAILIDFGVSKQYDSVGDQTSTTPVGISYGYAPIEQYRPGGVSEFSPQADIYALGATLYKMITGNIPPQAIEIFNAGQLRLPQYLSFKLDSAIRKAMQLNKQDRPKNVTEFLRFFNAIKKEQKETPIATSNSLANNTKVLIKQVKPKNMINGHEYVDLGLPSGLKWATCNVGANKPEEFGELFSWGEVKMKIEHTENNYEHGKFVYQGGFLGIGGTRFLKNDDIGSNISGTKYDVARVNWGGSWRMPTKEEFEELMNYSTICWGSNQNGINGTKIISKINGNSIFFPDNVYTEGRERGDGYYWSSTPEYSRYNYCAYGLLFYYGGHKMSSFARKGGVGVRPVSI